jgi:hypothetical protein
MIITSRPDRNSHVILSTEATPGSKETSFIVMSTHAPGDTIGTPEKPVKNVTLNYSF